MFKVRNNRSGEIMVTLDYDGREKLEEAFRKLSIQGDLKCPHCNETVVFRHGEILCPHFSHRPNSACPYSQETMDLLEARSVLYRFLKKNCMGKVLIEHVVENSALPRAVDCWVERDGLVFAYWIFERGTRSAEKRKSIRGEFRKLEVKPHFVFHSQMLQRGEMGKGAFSLEPTERYFLRRTKFDPEHSSCGSLQYIDPHRGQWSTLRGLEAIGCVGQFQGTELRNPLEWVKVCEETGETFHPGEQEHQTFQQAVLFEEPPVSKVSGKKEPAPISPYAHLAPNVRKWREELDKLPRTNETVRQIIDRLHRKGRDDTPISYEDRKAICGLCGETTRDWIVFDGRTGRCKCRACYAKKKDA